MVPRTFPSTYASNGQQQMVVHFLTDVTGLQRWLDYIPVKLSQGGTENSYDNDGYIDIAVASITSVSVPFKDYVPVYVDSAASDAWQVNSVGYIPYGYALFSDAAMFQDFTNGASLDPRITFSRASNATVTGPDGTLQYAPHNLLTYSEQFDNAAWSKTGATVAANSEVAPDGTRTADTLVEDSSNSVHRVFQTLSGTLGAVHTHSCYVKAGTRSWFYFDATDAGGTRRSIWFNVYNGTIGTAQSGWTNAVITPEPNGYFRCSASLNMQAGSNLMICAFASADSINVYQGNDSASGFIWGAQRNIGPLQPYYPTTVKNLLGFTQEFDGAAWVKLRSSITANAEIALNGTLTADTIVGDGTGASYVYQSVSFTSGTTYTLSVYAKPINTTSFILQSFTQPGLATFTLSGNGSVVSTTGIISSATITPLSNGWYRCSATMTATSTANNNIGFPSVNYNGNICYLWGAQLSDSASLDEYVYNPGAAPAAAAYYGPRFDYDPVTLAPKGLLIEEQRTQLFLQSGFAGAVAGENMGTAPASWTIGFGVGVTASLPASTLGTDAVAIKLDAPNGTRGYYQQTITVAAGQYAVSAYVEAVEGLIGQFITIISGTATATITQTANNPATGRQTLLFTSSGAGTVTIRIGVGTTGVLVGDASVTFSRPQVESGSFNTSYIPTTTAAATRAADVAVMTGANFSNWFGSPNENTFYVEASKPQTNNANAILLEGADIKGLTISTDGNGIKARVLVRQGAARMDSGSSAPVFAADSVLKIAAGTSASGSAAVFNGTVISTGTPSQNDWGNELRIGNRILLPITVTNYWNGHIRRIAYFPRRLANAELQAITS